MNQCISVLPLPVISGGMPGSIRNLSVPAFQGLNSFMYATPNDRDYSLPDMATTISGHTCRVSKCVHKKKHEKISWHLCMGFSWSLGLANKLHIDVADCLWKHFPGCCPYCAQPACACKSLPARPPSRQIELLPQSKRPSTLREFQKMFAAIYPQTLEEAAWHMTGEAAELVVAVTLYERSHDFKKLPRCAEELMDFHTLVFAVATNAGLDLAMEMEKHFENGCPGCRQSPCGCDPLHEDPSL